MNRTLGFFFGLALAAVLAATVAATGPAGYPSRPKFQQVTITGAVSNPLTINRTSGTANILATFQRAGASDGFIGAAGAAGGLTTGTAAGDMVLRGQAGSVWITADGGATSIAQFSNAAINFAATSVRANGADIATASTGTLTASATTACSTTPTVALTWNKIGNVVNLMATGTISCTSDSAIFALDDGTLPAAIRPAANQCAGAGAGVDNGTNVAVYFRIESDGGVNIANGIGGSTTACSATAWTASGTKGLGQFSITYAVN